jgi:phosphatidylethanolamine-binding protein (PEBP) family uncharacterized protein
VLALAALSLAGCGGGSSGGQDSTASSAGSGTEASAGSDTQGAGAGPAQGDKEAGNSAQAGEEGSEGGAGNGSAPGQSGQKHGPRIAQPKGPQEKAPTPQEIANATVADITLESYSPFESETPGEPASLPANYSCDDEDKWPQFHWSGVPKGTAEVILYGMNVQPVDGKLFVDWAVAGLDPNLPEIVSGRLPKGAVVGTNSFGKQGYSLCPEGKGEIYMFALYALPKRLGLKPGFDAREARAQILEVSGNVGLLPMLYAHH